MATLTAFVLAAFVGYAASWYLGMIEGNFALLMFLATVVTGIYWLAERLHFLPQRQAAAARLEAETASRRAAAAILALNDVALAKKLDAYRAKQTKAVLDNPIPGRQGKQR